MADGGWLEKPILMKTQSSVWTWTLDFDLGFVKDLKKIVRRRRHVLTRKVRKYQAEKEQITPLGPILINICYKMTNFLTKSKYFGPINVFDAKV